MSTEWSSNGDYSLKAVSEDNAINYCYFHLPVTPTNRYEVKGTIKHENDESVNIVFRARVSSENINNQIVLSEIVIPKGTTNFILTGTIPEEYYYSIVLFHIHSESTIYFDDLQFYKI